jgi:hypothetical protein
MSQSQLSPKRHSVESCDFGTLYVPKTHAGAEKQMSLFFRQRLLGKINQQLLRCDSSTYRLNPLELVRRSLLLFQSLGNY